MDPQNWIVRLLQQMSGGEGPADQKRCEPGPILMGQAREKLILPAVPDIPVGDGCVNAGTVHDPTLGASARIAASGLQTRDAERIGHEANTKEDDLFRKAEHCGLIPNARTVRSHTISSKPQHR
jgi:hypothetical protein